MTGGKKIKETCILSLKGYNNESTKNTKENTAAVDGTINISVKTRKQHIVGTEG